MPRFHSSNWSLRIVTDLGSTQQTSVFVGSANKLSALKKQKAASMFSSGDFTQKIKHEDSEQDWFGGGVIFVLILNGNTVNATDNNLSFVFAIHVLNSGVCAVDLKCLKIITFLC